MAFPPPTLRALSAMGFSSPVQAGRGRGRFWHLSIAETPGIAAEYADDGGAVFEVDLGGLDLPEEGFVGGEMRLHEDVPPGRLQRMEPKPRVDRAGHVDPFYMPGENHPTCLRLRCWER
jgi:hypothetical protein